MSLRNVSIRNARTKINYVIGRLQGLQEMYDRADFQYAALKKCEAMLNEAVDELEIIERDQITGGQNAEKL